ncbi:hypothetical protein PVAND_015425 [Polypedilum vanderplanki]|uniref:non-specific serine/threonine protein kinase n=1 Tax=Polypedilum vanderplanki TaxID=319348 RepID=A0A9J6BCK0_POLVA|nr:hypothetical protein PVAND_015425 [Polypedilum vanderplanki]
MTTSTAQQVDHIDLTKLPVHEKTKLCAILDQNETWAELGKLMMFNAFEIMEMQTEADRKRKSPSEVLITKWSRHGHIVTELFKLLSIMQHYQAMEAIKHSVPSAYHIWIKPVQPHISRLINGQQISSKLQNIHENVQQSQIFQSRQDRPNVVTKNDIKDSLRELLNIPEIPIDELAFATNNWSEENVLGKGGFGTVYKGEWLSTKVAIKKLEYRESRSGTSRDYLLQSLNELRHLNHCRHDNILPIYGYSLKDETCLVVYQLMPGGSLEERLSRKNGSEALTWPQRWTVSKGTARGLQYLHRFSQKPLIHGDIKPANILLDTCGEPKIGDFGLSREGHIKDDYQELSRVFGTKPYLPKEFLNSHLFSTKVDVFSFGVVLFELATGFKAYDKSRKLPFLYDHLSKLDESLLENITRVIDKSTVSDGACLNLCQLMIYLGKKCCDHNPNYRPDMASVLKALETFNPVIVMNTNGN